MAFLRSFSLILLSSVGEMKLSKPNSFLSMPHTEELKIALIRNSVASVSS